MCSDVSPSDAQHDQIDQANALRLKALAARERAVALEQAVSWCRGRIKFLEAAIAAGKVA